MVQRLTSLFQMSGWRSRRSAGRYLLLLVGTLLIFYLLFRSIDLSQVLGLLAQVPWLILLFAGILTLSIPLLSAIRWKVILRTMDHEISVSRAILIIVGIWPLSAVSPSKSGDLLRAYSLRRNMDSMIVAGSIITERGLDFLVLATLALVGGLLFHEDHIVLVALAVFTGVLAGIVFARLDLSLPLGQKIQGKLRDLLQSLRVLGQEPGLLLIILLFTVAKWFVPIWQTQLLFQGVGAHVSLGFTAAALPVAIFVGLLPISLGGMGTRDAAMVVLFAAYASASQALAVGLLYSFFAYWLIALLGLPLMRRALDIGT